METPAKSPQPVELADVDRVRMRRLYEETAGRITEMGLIMARTLGGRVKSGAGTIEFSQRPEDSINPGSAAKAKREHIKVCMDGICWEDPPGICYPDPKA